MLIKSKIIVLLIVSLHFTIRLIANEHQPEEKVIPFDSPRWVFEAKNVVLEEFQGNKCLQMTNGVAYIKDAEFINGVIEYDIAVPHTPCFPAVYFRMQDKNNTEQFYIRPHQSGNPDAMQYTPSYHGITAWQMYYGDGFSTAKDYFYDRWMHIRLVVSGKMAEVYFNHEESPTLFIHTLKRKPMSGMLGLAVSNDVTIRFANFSYTEMDNPVLKNTPRVAESLPEGLVKIWSVSNVFDEKTLENKVELSKAARGSFSWQPHMVESKGVVNLAELDGVGPNKNTVLAGFKVTSDVAQIKKMMFGFSDRVRVYLNGKLIYAGNDNFRSRDYRFLGTVGYWDELYLSLLKGENEVIFAVSEIFGGWAIQTKFEDMSNLTLE